MSNVANGPRVVIWSRLHIRARHTRPGCQHELSAQTRPFYPNVSYVVFVLWPRDLPKVVRSLLTLVTSTSSPTAIVCPALADFKKP